MCMPSMARLLHAHPSAVPASVHGAAVPRKVCGRAVGDTGRASPGMEGRTHGRTDSRRRNEASTRDGLDAQSWPDGCSNVLDERLDDRLEVRREGKTFYHVHWYDMLTTAWLALHGILD